jgi:hypothetical protein
VRKLPYNAESLTTPAVSRVFLVLSFASHWIRAHFVVDARTASFSAASVHLCHPNLPEPVYAKLEEGLAALVQLAGADAGVYAKLAEGLVARKKSEEG